MNSKTQGNIGVGQAIAYYTLNGHTVSIPLNDSQKYDLIVDIDGILAKVQVKTTNFKDGSYYQVNLKTSGGNQSRNSIVHFDNKESDILFIWCGNGDLYEIPSGEVDNKSSLNLGDKWKSYKVQL